MNIENTLGMKFPVGDVSAKAAMAAKKLTGLSLGDIKAKAMNDEFIMLFDYLDDDSLKKMNRLKREMKKFGIEMRQFEDGIEKSQDLFDNIEQLHREIDENPRY